MIHCGNGVVIMKYIYNLLVLALALVSLPILAFRVLRETGMRDRIKQVLGWLPPDVIEKVTRKDCIWLHAASVGEVVAASPLIREVSKNFPGVPILLSVMTPSGYEMARRIAKEADAVIYFPFDLPGIGSQVIRSIIPQAIILVETELWPNFLAAAGKQNIPVMMVNGRISDKSMRRYHYFGGLVKNMLKNITKFCMQSPLDAERIIALGANPKRVVITGNTKFDQNYNDISLHEKELLLQEMGLVGYYPLLLAGSTHKGEEEVLLEAFGRIRVHYPNAKMIIAPREVLRTEEIIKLASSTGYIARRRTLSGALAQNVVDIVVLDTIGELGKMYSLGDIVFVGGSLITHGGHNILEPAVHGKPILVGPNMFNFKQTYALLSGREACLTVSNADELTEKTLMILQNEQLKQNMGGSARAVIEENRGAAQKSIAYLKEILQ